MRYLLPIVILLYLAIPAPAQDTQADQPAVAIDTAVVYAAPLRSVLVAPLRLAIKPAKALVHVRKCSKARRQARRQERRAISATAPQNRS